jgi:hypothetical protein
MITSAFKDFNISIVRVRMQGQKPIPPPFVGHKLPHEVLPPEVEDTLPENVLETIYSFLRRSKRPAEIRIQQTALRINLKVRTANRLRHEMLRRRLAKLKQEQRRRALIKTLDNMVEMLEKAIKN